MSIWTQHHIASHRIVVVIIETPCVYVRAPVSARVYMSVFFCISMAKCVRFRWFLYYSYMNSFIISNCIVCIHIWKRKLSLTPSPSPSRCNQFQTKWIEMKKKRRKKTNNDKNMCIKMIFPSLPRLTLCNRQPLPLSFVPRENFTHEQYFAKKNKYWKHAENMQTMFNACKNHLPSVFVALRAK